MIRTILTLLTLSASSGAMSQEMEMSPTDPLVAGVVASMLEHQHLMGERIDDERSSEWLHNYLDAIDPQRMYFIQEDIHEFTQWETQLDDLLADRMHSDLSPALFIWRRYIERHRQATDHYLQLMDSPPDFTVDESWDLDRDDAGWPQDETAAAELRRQYVKELWLRAVLDDGEDSTKELQRLRERFERNHQNVSELEAIDILEIYLTALTETLDPHSTYMAPARQDNFEIDLSNSVEGIGAVLRKIDEYTTIESLVPGGPASESGELKPGDRILAVAQGNGEPEDIVDIRLDKVVRQIRGKKGTKVRLTVWPVGSEDPNDTRIVTITRDKVELLKSKAKSEVREITSDTGQTAKIHVIDIPSFYAPVSGYGGVTRVSEDVRKLLTEARKDDADAVIVDLRMNSGGSLMESINLTGLFIDRGPVVQARSRSGEVDVYRDQYPGTSWDGPVVVLTSEFSASASEIFAGAIQDYGRGLVVGSDRTHGKGTVQTLIDLDRLMGGMAPEVMERGAGTLKLTVQQFYRVNGSSTQARGVKADVVLPSPWEGRSRPESELENALPHDIITPAITGVPETVRALLPELRSRSEKRVADNELLQIFKRNAAQLAEWEARGGVVSLNLETRRAELEKQKALDDALPDTVDMTAATEDGEEATPLDPVLDEALQITRDFVSLRQTG